jgi:hydrogenase maturation protease
MQRTDFPLLVVGCGSEVAGDDAVGSELVQLLARLHPRGDVRFALLPRPGLELLEVFEHEEHIVFVDAIVSDRDPGTVLIAPLPSDGVRLRSSVAAEGFGIDEVLALGRSLGRRVPLTTLLGIEVSGCGQASLLSEPVAHAMNFLIEKFDEIRTTFGKRETIAITPWEAYADA